MSIRSGGDSKQSLRHCQHTASFFGEYRVCLKQDTIVQTNARDLRWETKEYQATNLVVALGMRWWGSYQNGKAGKAETFNFTRPVVIRGKGGNDYDGGGGGGAGGGGRGARGGAARGGGGGGG